MSTTEGGEDAHYSIVVEHYSPRGTLLSRTTTRSATNEPHSGTLKGRAMAIQRDGGVDGIVVAADGYLAGAGENYEFVLARFLPDGSLDPSFGSGGGHGVTEA